MTLHLQPLTATQPCSDTLTYSVRIVRQDPATGRHDTIEIDGYGVLDELLDALDGSMQRHGWRE